MPSSSTVEALLHAKQMTRLTGTLDELQQHQLGMWGRVAFDGGAFGLAWDGTTRTVEYDLAANSHKPVAATCAVMEASLHDLLGTEWLLVIKQMGGLLFTGKRGDIIRQDPQDPGRLIKKPFDPNTKEEALAPPRGNLGPGADDE